MLKLYYAFFGLIVLYTVILTANFFVGQYATATAGPSIPDVFDFFADEKYLALREFALQIHLYWNTFLFVPFVVYGLFAFPKETFHFLALKALVILARLCTVAVTHLGPVFNTPTITGVPFTFGGDLFFSGHVAGSFVLYLAFRKTSIAYFLLAYNLLISVSVIVGRLHYTIDVIAAYVFAYAIYKFTEPHFEKLKVKYFGDINSTSSAR